MPAPFAAAASASRSTAPPAPTLAIRSIPAKRSNASARVSRSGCANGSIVRPRKANSRRPAVSAASASSAAQSAISAS